MRTARPSTALIEVETLELTRALKHLLKCERRTYQPGTLTFSTGLSEREVAAKGTWTGPGSVVRAWAESLSKTPFEAAITPLELKDGRLRARSFSTPYLLDPQPERNSDANRRDADILASRQVLARYKVTVRDMTALVDAADCAKARDWGAGEDPLIDDVARVWMQPEFYGVHPAEIRSLLIAKSRALWKNKPRSGDRVLGRYDVTLPERSSLIGKADPKKARLWSRVGASLLADVAATWKILVFYGVEPSDILRLIKCKSASRALACDDAGSEIK